MSPRGVLLGNSHDGTSFELLRIYISALLTQFPKSGSGCGYVLDPFENLKSLKSPENTNKCVWCSKNLPHHLHDCCLGRELFIYSLLLSFCYTSLPAAIWKPFKTHYDLVECLCYLMRP
jgi:hypothetical protein